MKFRYLVLLMVLAVPVSAEVVPWCGNQLIYFSHAGSPDITGYEGLKIYPDGSPQEDENVTVKNTLGTVLIDSYVSDPGLPDIASIRAGLWRFRTYHYVSLSSGATKFNYTVFKRSQTGTETKLFSVLTEDVDALAATEYLTSHVTQTDTPMLPTDRLVIKVYAQSDHASNVLAHFLYEGTTNTSHVSAPLMVCHQVSGGSADSGGAAVAGAFGLVAGLIGAVLMSKRLNR